MDHREPNITAIPHCGENEQEGRAEAFTCLPRTASSPLHGEVPRCRDNHSYSQFCNLFNIAHAPKESSPVFCKGRWEQAPRGCLQNAEVQ
jgi:hypothetical protein